MNQLVIYEKPEPKQASPKQCLYETPPIELLHPTPVSAREYNSAWQSPHLRICTMDCFVVKDIKLYGYYYWQYFRDRHNNHYKKLCHLATHNKDLGLI